MHRVGAVLHPTRPLRSTLDALEAWTENHGLELVRFQTADDPLARKAPAELAQCDLIVAIGGDGTVLTALHAGSETRTPVLGVACGSLGALSTVSEADFTHALDRIAAGEWSPQHLPALTISTTDGPIACAINDLVLVRRSGTQLIVEVMVGDDLYVRLAGDGVLAATPLGSSAYTMAAGGPVLVEGVRGVVCTPLAMHGGCAPPAVLPPDKALALCVESGYGGFDVQVDGHRVDSAAERFVVSMQDDYATLVRLDSSDSGLCRLRRRGLITDSPRVLARDARAHLAAATPP